MDHRHNSIRESGRIGWFFFRLAPAIGRLRPLILLAGAVAICYGIYQQFQAQETVHQAMPNMRMPVTNSPLEPDRPDLLGEPRIDE